MALKLKTRNTRKQQERERKIVKTEKEKMLAGELYNAIDQELAAERLRARALCQKLARLDPLHADSERSTLIEQLLGAPSNVYITPPFFCDYGYNIRMGENVYFNFNCVILDVAQVSIGNNVLIGPSVQIYTALHPLDAERRRSGLESAKPVVIGDDVWIGGGVIVCPGVTIGARAVVGAGSVVTRAIPPDVLAAGNPCRVIRAL
jgi:maltose O-acetyltransferase